MANGVASSRGSAGDARDEAIRLAERLAAGGWLAEAQLQEVRNRAGRLAARMTAADSARRAPDPVEILAGLELVDPEGRPWDEERLLRAVAELLGLPFEHVDPLKVDSELATKVFSRPFAERHLLVPLRLEGDTLVVASGRPLDEEGREMAARTAGRTVRFVLAPPSELRPLLRELYGFRTSVQRAQAELAGPSVDLQNLEQLVRLKGERELEASDQHVVNAVDYLFRYAFELRASDIHIEPKRDHAVVRFRIDGVLHQVHRYPRAVHAAIVSRIKTLARMDIAERRRPQDGRIKTIHGEQQIELRISTLPVAFGEKVVVRIFDPGTIHGDLHKLGFRAQQLDRFQAWIRRPHGVILVTGPTGSGKSTTLYTALLNIADESRNVVTIEDPIEMMFEAFNQVAVQPAIGLTFASALRTILRQDPDVIMVGEIRDAETAAYAIQAALTGHLVLSTLHTNDAPTAVPRLLDLGVERFLVANALVGVMAQRLVRKVCSNCAVEELLPAAELRELGAPIPPEEETVAIVRGQGCPACRGTGYRGRVAIFEMLDWVPELREAVAGGADVEEIRRIGCRYGMVELRTAGMELVVEGVTTPEEVLRVTATS